MALVAGEIISFVTFLVGQALISGQGPSATLGEHDVLRAVVGAGLYLAVLGLLGSALGRLAPPRRRRHREHRRPPAGAARHRRRPAVVVVAARREVLAHQRRPAGGRDRPRRPHPAGVGWFGVMALFTAVVLGGRLRAAGAAGRLTSLGESLG